jgi:hypothetical protein
MECITSTIDYIESHFEKSSSAAGISDADLLNLLTGNGGSQVDVVIYVVLHSEYLQESSMDVSYNLNRTKSY